MELVIVNDLAEQTLVLPDCPDNIRVFNLDTRCDNLGQKRNEVAKLCSSELIITWSDDDIHLPNRIANNVAAYTPGKYVTEGRYVFLSGPNSKHVKHRMCGPFLMSKEDFWSLGGIPDADNGEDLLFLNKVRAQLKVVEAPDTNYIYRWETGRFHASHLDKKQNAWQRYHDIVKQTLRDGREPSGVVKLKPNWKVDYVALASTFQ